MRTSWRRAEGGWGFAFPRRAWASRLLLPACFALLAVLSGAMSGASAQVTTDPTRPPAGYADAEPAAAGDAGGAMTLQSVMISPTHRSAIISGVVVRLGEKYGDAVLVKVAESEVVLKSGETQQVLRLYPGVDKREVEPVATKTDSHRRKAPPAPGAAPR